MENVGERRDPISGVTPYLTVNDGSAAVDFYVRAFDARELFRAVADDGKRLMHCQLDINGAVVMLSDHFAEMSGGAPAPQPAGVLLSLAVRDADAAWDRAVKAGAKITHPIGDQFWGERWGRLEDPFGHAWSISGPLKK